MKTEASQIASNPRNLNASRARYEDHYVRLGREFRAERAAELAVGGDFVTVGRLEYYLLKAYGLQTTDRMVDVGCGTGRLAHQLAKRDHEHYAGFDVSETAVEYARNLCARPDWRFGVTNGLRIDLPDQAADFVCFFSVFTHIPHEHTYLYLEETRRLLRPGGLAIFSFLEFAIGSHWTQFEGAVRNFSAGLPATVFIDRQAISQFARFLNYEMVALLDGDKPSFPIEEEIVWGGTTLRDRGFLGQSVAVLRKP